jgi:hypothetical protein
VERPKSAMLKEVHPEYDLRKSREDVYEIEEYPSNDYDGSKSFSIDSNIMPASPKYSRKPDKASGNFLNINYIYKLCVDNHN